jgi:hypothetical protein
VTEPAGAPRYPRPARDKAARRTRSAHDKAGRSTRTRVARPAPAQGVLVCRRASKSYSDLVALAPLDLAVAPGERIAGRASRRCCGWRPACWS